MSRIERGEGEVPQILEAIGRGERQAASELLPLVYDELRKLAVQRLARESSGQTLQATALVHEAYLRLVDTPAPYPNDGLLALDDALTRLAEEDAVAAKVVELRQFAGLGHEDVAAALGITVYLARQKWTYARAWLRDAIGD